jgi:hypothetical protein
MKHLAPLFLIFTATCLAQPNWPQFRGEGGLRIGSGKPPLEFSAEKKREVAGRGAQRPTSASPHAKAVTNAPNGWPKAF